MDDEFTLFPWVTDGVEWLASSDEGSEFVLDINS